MTHDDITRIESELEIELPPEYAERMVSLSDSELLGNTTFPVWDDPTALIQLNRIMRSGQLGVPPWPRRFFAVGQSNGDPSLHAIDLSTATGLWVDHGFLSPTASGEVSVGRWLADLLADKPSSQLHAGPPKPLAALERSHRHADLAILVSCGIATILGILVVLAVIFL